MRDLLELLEQAKNAKPRRVFCDGSGYAVLKCPGCQGTGSKYVGCGGNMPCRICSQSGLITKKCYGCDNCK